MNELADRKRRRAPRGKKRLPDPEQKQKRAAKSEAAAWAKACNEVVASILSDHLHKTGQPHPAPGIVTQSMRGRVEQAKKELGDHVAGDAGCMCRHHALITVGAAQQARMTGVRQDFIFDGARAVLEKFMARRS
jgi:hypothetical protein